MVSKWTGQGDEINWDESANWTSSPSEGDVVVIDLADYDITAGLLYGSAYITYDSFNMAGTTTTIGTDEQALELYADVVNIGYQLGSSQSVGSQRIHIDTMGHPTAITVFGSSSTSAVSGYMPVRIKANDVASTYNIKGGKVGIADQADEISLFSSLNVSGDSTTVVVGHQSDSTAVTMTTVNVAGGNVTLHSGGTTLNVDGGTVRIEAGTWTTINVRGGTLISNTSGTITTLNMYGGTTDFNRSTLARTVTTPTIYSGARLLVDKTLVTFTNKLALGSDEAMEISVG